MRTFLQDLRKYQEGWERKQARERKQAKKRAREAAVGTSRRRISFNKSTQSDLLMSIIVQKAAAAAEEQDARPKEPEKINKDPSDIASEDLSNAPIAGAKPDIGSKAESEMSRGRSEMFGVSSDNKSIQSDTGFASEAPEAVNSRERSLLYPCKCILASRNWGKLRIPLLSTLSFGSYSIVAMHIARSATSHVVVYLSRNLFT